MIKINYPSIKKDIEILEDAYLKTFNCIDLNKKISILFKNNLSQFNKYSIEKILLLSIENLYKLSIELDKKMSDRQRKQLKSILNYDKGKGAVTTKQQPKIAKFFMESSSILDISTCYFCNIDFVNSINIINDFISPLDLIKRGDINDLESIKGIDKATAISIFKNKRNISNISQLKLTQKQLGYLGNMTPKATANHFTLDHVLNKADYPIAALSLYNFVPCCYNCNSKFKRDEPLIRSLSETHLSPTSKQFVFDKNVKFKICFPLNPLHTFKDIKTTNDFTLTFDISSNKNHYEEYLRIFKIKSRYVFHKSEVLKIVAKRKKYSDSQIKEIAKITNSTIDEVSKDIFGEELFENRVGNIPFTKLRRDIAKDIGIKNIL